MLTAKTTRNFHHFRRTTNRGFEWIGLTNRNTTYLVARDRAGEVIYRNTIRHPDRRTALSFIAGFYGLPIAA